MLICLISAYIRKIGSLNLLSLYPEAHYLSDLVTGPE